jgi:hypothetical protein
MISMLQKLRNPFAEFGPGADFLYAIDRVRSSLSTRAAACLRTHRAADSRQAAAAATSAALQFREIAARATPRHCHTPM